MKMVSLNKRLFSNKKINLKYFQDLFDKLDNLLIDLNEINQKYNLILTKFRQKKLKLPIIFSEIFELPNELTNS